MQSRALVRTAVIVLFTALALIVNGGDILLPWHPFSTLGFSSTFDGTVTAVDPQTARAGLRPGDRIDVPRLSIADRMKVGYLTLAREGMAVRLPLTTGRSVTVTSHLWSRSFADNITDIFAVLSLALYIAVAALLVLLRPTPATWAFYVFSYWFCFQGTIVYEYIPLTALLACTALGFAMQAASPFALIAFALRFPNEHPRGVARTLERALILGAAPALMAASIALFLHAVLAGNVQPGLNSLRTAIIDVAFAAGVIVLLARYAGADRDSRARLQWIVAAFSVAFLPAIALVFVLAQLGIFPPVWVINCSQTWEILAPAALAYTVLRHRLFDIRFVFSRALLYGTITSLTIGILALVDWGFGRWLTQSRFALVAELALALLLGIGITLVHRRIEYILNRVIFRAQTLALEALRRFGHEVDLIADPQRLLMQTYDALYRRLECEYVGVYTEEGASFALATPSADAQPALLPNDDFAVLRLRRWSEPFECDEPQHPLRGALLVPMTARTQLVGFIACGPKRDHTHYLPEEIETLTGLAHRTAAAYAWLTLRAPGIGLDEIGRASTTS